MLNNGFVEYVHIADEHTHLLLLMLAGLLKVFDGFGTIIALRVLHGIIISLTVLLAVGVAFWQSGRWAALPTGLFLWAFPSRFGYWGMWHKLALALLYILCFIILVSLSKYHPFLKFVGIGIVCAVAILIKQQAALLIFAFLGWLGWQAKTRNFSNRQLLSSNRKEP